MFFFFFNTSDFSELSFFPNRQLDLAAAGLFVISGVVVKAGALGFQFLKVEVYKSLRLDAVINFSFLSLVFYTFVF